MLFQIKNLYTDILHYGPTYFLYRNTHKKRDRLIDSRNHGE